MKLVLLAFLLLTLLAIYLGIMLIAEKLLHIQIPYEDLKSYYQLNCWNDSWDKN